MRPRGRSIAGPTWTSCARSTSKATQTSSNSTLTAAPQNISDQVGFTGDVLHIVRIRRERRTGEPLLVTEAWLPASLAEAITPEKLVHAPLYRLLAEAGVTLEQVQHSSSPRSLARAPHSSSTSPSVPRCSASTGWHSPQAIEPTVICQSCCRPAEAASCSTTPQTNWRSATPWQSHMTCGPTDSLRWPDAPQYPGRRACGRLPLRGYATVTPTDEARCPASAAFRRSVDYPSGCATRHISWSGRTLDQNPRHADELRS